MTYASTTPLLRRALFANAAFSLLTGLAMIVASGPLADVLGLGTAVPLLIVGPGLLLFAGDMVHQATRERISLTRAKLTTLNDAMWVVGTAVLLLVWPRTFSTTGTAIAVAIAVVVAGFGAAQLAGIRRAAA